MSCTVFDGANTADIERLRLLLARRRSLALDAGGDDIEEKVRAILADVKKNNLEAIVKYTRDFDCPVFTPEMFQVSKECIRKAAEDICCADAGLILEAAENIRSFHREQKEKAWFLTRPDGTLLGQVINPVCRAGLYVPGGKGGETPLISSLLMAAVPAMVAGVREIAVVTPPRADGGINPFILAAAGLLGISEVYACGSSWGIAALVYGAGALKPVDVIAGPGNIWVTTAKRLVIGQVGIDMIAGPSEITIIADSSAIPSMLAADMLSQAEHDTLASAICLVTDKTLISPLLSELEKQCALLPRADLAAQSLKDWGGVVHIPTLEAACTLANEIAPEHLEIMCDHPMELLPHIHSAGSIFLGHNSAEALGDYFAGPNHVLPTMGTARFSSGLGVQTFMTRSNVIGASRNFAGYAAKHVARLARLEGLEAHAKSAEARAFEPLPRADSCECVKKI